MKPGLLSFLLGHLLVGVLAGWMVLGLLLWFDVAGLWSLIAESDSAGLVLALLAFGFAVTFGSLAMGTGVMGLTTPRPPRAPPARRLPADPLPQRVRSRR